MGFVDCELQSPFLQLFRDASLSSHDLGDSLVSTDALQKGLVSFLFGAIGADVGQCGLGEYGVGGLPAKGFDRVGA